MTDPALAPTAASLAASSPRPRLGFVGVGWIGRNRMEALVEAGAADVAAVAEPDDALRAAVHEVAPGAALHAHLDALLAHDLDGVVIATPSALHAEQSIRALEAGCAVFCQKPLGRDGDEAARVVDAARRADRLLGVDLSYREVDGVDRMRELVQRGALGDVYAVDLVFHNAYGPDKAWFFDPARSGGGCVIDLGVHLVDLALWTLGFPEVVGAASRLYREGRPLAARGDTVEDFATATVDLASGATVRLACSWHLPAGQDAVIGATFYGSEGAVALRNLDGSFYDFAVERHDGRVRRALAEPAPDWGGRAAVRWARRLAESRRFDPAVDDVVAGARVLDAIYDAARLPHRTAVPA